MTENIETEVVVITGASSGLGRDAVVQTDVTDREQVKALVDEILFRPTKQEL